MRQLAPLAAAHLDFNAKPCEHSQRAMSTRKDALVGRFVATNLRIMCLVLAGLPATGLLAIGCGEDAQDGRGSNGGAGAAGKGGSSSAGNTAAGSSAEGGSSADGGSAPAGSGQGGMGGDAPHGGSTAGGVGGEGSGGRAAAGEGGSAGAANAGSGGGDPGSIEYRACELATAVDRIVVFRIDEAAGTCTRVVLLGGSSCNLGVAAGGWCLEQAQLSADVAACKTHMVPADPKLASSATGTISVSGSVAELDVTLEFPAGGGLPSSVSVAVSDCTADCMQNDCRP